LEVIIKFSPGVRISCLIKFSKIVPIMLALCLMLLDTYYALNYAGIIGWGLVALKMGKFSPSEISIFNATRVVFIPNFTVTHAIPS